MKDPQRLGAWLRTIAIHRSIKHRKRGQRRAELDASALLEGEVPTPAEELEQSELRDQVMAAIGRLSKVQRETVALYSLFSPEVDRLIVAMRKPEWVMPNAESARRGPLSDEERVWLLERVAEDGAGPGVDELGRSTE